MSLLISQVKGYVHLVLIQNEPKNQDHF